MDEQQKMDYDRIAIAIEHIKSNFKNQPSLDDLAEVVHLSSFHFQRMFNDWAGVSPKKFTQYLTLEYAKELLTNQKISISETAFELGLSGTSRLHDLFISIEGMTPGEFKKGGKALSIKYSLTESPFGKIIVASTSKGICHMAFYTNKEEAIEIMKKRFPNASYLNEKDGMHENAIGIFYSDWNNLDKVKLHLNGTDFQLKVWESLLKIPFGGVSTYGKVAQSIGNPKASRAVGTAIGSNPVSFLIPCHRVIQSSGNTGQYMWGAVRKSAILGWEAVKINS
ncbi:bifunctional helix-turn-helix domain-containing protein/methylated-DNA--[protein]-cysteine S-methyltransferase [Flammeovirga kamogawensis]|uniref:Methylated-DNA--[protein]-cysteine S-methyltransferase n=1 Tax=Flammeovirga kamogawensis TaxID=373891 RepID=A0ABX8H4Z3_9BACT|nr:methylated-DNA--[protein]-cysteine S-methyltransferase [Flammeovirga kamogawensis]MBB6461734.1 AraC family transcriptional regulator of adaptative response/methylated-DNA-[protein]-cysteine methyltransferase [Flammeovirga kamogawensis]QWG10652.1 methylated-DNA--[protein]-cysteine S-methyltransferase [Flammeovirga kamogawensis]TRX63756.1 methylated-DNA--[protein]-cysteine S-methyltransferase [Flammeovirga kamogawensis]